MLLWFGQHADLSVKRLDVVYAGSINNVTFGKKKKGKKKPMAKVLGQRMVNAKKKAKILQGARVVGARVVCPLVVGVQ